MSQKDKEHWKTLFIGIILGMTLTGLSYAGLLNESAQHALNLNIWCKVTGCNPKY